MYRHCKNIINVEIIEKILGNKFTTFFNKYVEDLDILSRFYENDCLDVGYSLNGVDDEDDFNEVEKYYNEFLATFKEIQSEFKNKTGAILELGYAEDINDIVSGFYFYIKNAFIPNPEIKEDLFEYIETTAILEDFNN